jgi:hypothetical protein
MDEAFHAMEDNKWSLMDMERQEEDAKARDENMAQFFQDRETFENGLLVDDIATEKSALDDQIALTAEKKGLWDTEKATLDAYEVTLDAAKTAW